MRTGSLRWLLSIAVAFAVAGGAALAGSTPTSRVAAVTVDGDVADWKDVPAQTSEAEPKVTAVAQDAAFLYAFFSFSDLDLARRVLRTGAIVWVNTGGKHTEGYGLRFRGTEAMQKAVDEADQKARTAATQAAAPQAATAAGEQADTAPARNRQAGTARAPLGTLEVLHGGAVNELINVGARENGPAAACRFAGDTAVYEFRIPLAEIGLPPATGAEAAERTIAVGFQMSGRTQADRQAARTRQSGNRQRQIVPSPWATAPAGGGEAQPDAAASGAPATTGSAGAAGTPRRTYPTIWHDLSITPPAMK